MYRGEQGVIYSNEAKLYSEYLAQVEKEKTDGSGLYRFLLPGGKGNFQTDNGPVMSGLKNIKMDMLVEHYTTRMIVNELVSEPKLQEYKYAVLAALSCKADVDEFLTPAQKAKLRRPFAEVKDETVRLARQEFEDRLALHKAFVPGAPQGQYTIEFEKDKSLSNNFDKDRVSKLRYIVEGLGLPMEWSTIPNDNYYAFSSLVSLELGLWKSWLSDSGEEAKAYSIIKTEYDKLNFSNTQYQFFGVPEFEGTSEPPDSTELCNELKRLQKSI